jgi:hypothetical protein
MSASDPLSPRGTSGERVGEGALKKFLLSMKLPLKTLLSPTLSSRRGRRGRIYVGLVPRVARSSQPWADCRNPFGVLRFIGSMREISFGGILTPALSPGERE